MEMRPLQAEVHDAKVFTNCDGNQCEAKRTIDLALAKAAHCLRHAHSDEDRISTRQLSPRLVPLTRASSLAGPTRSFAGAAASLTAAVELRQLLLGMDLAGTPVVHASHVPD